jgi:hypothetical protein
MALPKIVYRYLKRFTRKSSGVHQATRRKEEKPIASPSFLLKST